MQVFRSPGDVPEGFGPTAVTIGKFDGLHRGHRVVIRELLVAAEERNLVPTVVTFDRNPLAVVRPDRCPDPLLSNDQKLERLAETGVAATLLLTFDEERSHQPADAFISEVLVGALRARLVLVGADFRFGARAAGTVQTLIDAGREHGFEVRVVAEVVSDARRASSTWVRELLAEGRVAEAGQLLEHAPTVRSVVVTGEQRGRELGYPTANLRPDPEGFIPADGVYAGRLTVDGVTYPAAISVGNNPTFEGVPARQVEAYVLDEDIDLYGRTVEIAFVDRIRGMEKFDSVDDLVTQLGRDVEATRRILAAPQGEPGREGRSGTRRP